MALEIAKGKRRRNHCPTISSLCVGSCGWREVEGLLGRDRRAKVLFYAPWEISPPGR